MRYKVRIKKVVLVEADSPEEAEDMACSGCADTDYSVEQPADVEEVGDDYDWISADDDLESEW